MTHCASSHNQNKDNNQFKNKKQPELTEIKLNGSLTTKELKKKHSSRPVGGAETGSQVERTHSKAVTGGPGKAVAWGGAVPHSCADKLRGTTRE